MMNHELFRNITSISTLLNSLERLVVFQIILSLEQFSDGAIINFRRMRAASFVRNRRGIDDALAATCSILICFYDGVSSQRVPYFFT